VITVLHPLLASAAHIRFGGDGFIAETARDLRAFVAGSLPPGAGWAPPARQRVTVGDTATSILDTAAAEQSSIVVVGTRGLGRTQRLWFGSTTAKLLKISTVPVLAIPDPSNDAGEAPAGMPLLDLERIVCGVDLDDPSTRAVRSAFELGRRLGVPVEIVHAIGNVAGPDALAPVLDATRENAVSTARQRLEQLLGSIGEQAPVSVRSGAAAEVLMGEIASGRPALLVMGLGSPGRTPGATATQVLAGSHAPVLAVPPL
jgi:nucleotide-binding universal stress UspA family protein